MCPYAFGRATARPYIVFLRTHAWVRPCLTDAARDVPTIYVLGSICSVLSFLLLDQKKRSNFAIKRIQTKIYFRFVEREQNQELKKSQDCGGCVTKNLSFRCRLNQTRCAQTMI